MFVTEVLNGWTNFWCVFEVFSGHLRLDPEWPYNRILGNVDSNMCLITNNTCTNPR